jgi:hypothetical protein
MTTPSPSDKHPVPFLIKIMADVGRAQHIVKDRLDDGTWALNPENYVSAGLRAGELRKRQALTLSPTTSTGLTRQW